MKDSARYGTPIFLKRKKAVQAVEAYVACDYHGLHARRACYMVIAQVYYCVLRHVLVSVIFDVLCERDNILFLLQVHTSLALICMLA